MGEKTGGEEPRGKVEKRYAAYVKARVRRAREPALPPTAPRTAHADWSALLGHPAADRIAGELESLKREYRALKRYMKALVRAEPTAEAVEDPAKTDTAETQSQRRKKTSLPGMSKAASPAKSAAQPRRRPPGSGRVSAKPTALRTVKSRRSPEADSTV